MECCPTKRLAWDGLWYTKEEFVDWYGCWRGHLYWDAASTICIRFMLLSGNAACQDLIVPSSSRISAWEVRYHLRTFSEQDDVYKLDYDSDLVVASLQPRQLNVENDDDVLALAEVRSLLVSSPGVVVLQVLRQPLWKCLI